MRLLLRRAWAALPLLLGVQAAALTETSGDAAQQAQRAQQAQPPPFFSTANFTQVGNFVTGSGPGPQDAGFVAPSFLSNGFHGLRVGPIPFVADPYAGTARPSGPYPGGTPTVSAVLAGYLHRDPKGRQRVLAAAPFPFGTAIMVGTTSLASDLHLVSVQNQSFDMRDGTLRTSLRFEGWQLEVEQFVSRSDPTIATMCGNRPGLQPFNAKSDHLTQIGSGQTLEKLRDKAFPCRRITATPTGAAEAKPITLTPNISLAGVPGVAHNDTTPEPNWTWDSCITLSLVSDCGSTLGLTAKAHTTNSTAHPGAVVYDLLVSSVAGEPYAPQVQKRVCCAI